MLFFGTHDLASGALTGTAVFAVTLGVAPTQVLPSVYNISSDGTKLMLDVWVTGVTSTGFTYALDAAPNTGNYKLAYIAGDPGLFAEAQSIVPAECSEIVARRVRQYCSCHLTEWDMRKYLNDHDVRDGMSGRFDVDIAPSMIAAAMEAAAREYNGIAPFTSRARADALEKNDNIFFDGTAYFVYMMKLQEEQRHDAPMTAGNVTVDIAARRIEHYMKSASMFLARFQTAAVTRKRAQNHTAGFARVG